MNEKLTDIKMTKVYIKTSTEEWKAIGETLKENISDQIREAIYGHIPTASEMIIDGKFEDENSKMIEAGLPIPPLNESFSEKGEPDDEARYRLRES